MGVMILMMNDTRVMSIEELQVFLRSSGSLKFNGYSRTETYALGKGGS